MPQLARRIGRAKPSAIMVIADKAKRLKAEGRDIINFSIGVPNFLPGEHVYAAAREAIAKDSGQYGSNRGSDALLDALLGHIEGLGLTGFTRANCAVGIGAKQVIYNLAEALLDEGDTIAFPVPYWTSYLDIAEIVNAKVDLLPCPASQHYKLTPDQLDAALAKKPKVFLFNNPSNPTGMVYTSAEIEALAEVIARHPDTWIITDDIYNRMLFDGLEYANFIQFRPELRERTIFIDSLSKTYGMPGWRVGFMCGNPTLIGALARMKSYLDYGMFTPIQVAAIAALEGPQECVAEICELYRKRRDVLCDGLNALGWPVAKPKATMFVWAPIPEPYRHLGSLEFCKKLLAEAKVAVSPGIGFGEYGDDHVRFGLIENEQRTRQALRGIREMLRRDGRDHDAPLAASATGAEA